MISGDPFGLADQVKSDAMPADQFPLLDHVASGILAIDRDANIILWNNVLEQWSNQTRQQVLGKNLFELYPYIGADVFKLRLEQVLAGGAPVVFSSQLHHHLIPCPLANGEYRSQLVTVTWLEKQQLALFSIQDQSEQVKLIQQYKASADKLKDELDQRLNLEAKNQQLVAAINQAAEAVVITDPHGQVEYANLAFLQQTGFSEAEMNRSVMYADLLEKNGIETDLQSKVLFSATETWTGRQNIMHRDGVSFTCSISIAPILNEAGKLTHHIIIQEDISQQIILEEKIRHTQKQEALITLIGGIAHDFNNLLAGLVGQVYLASREVADMPKTMGRMKKIQATAQDASDIVKQLLTFARQGEHYAKEFSLKSFMGEFFRLAQHSVPENITFTLDFEAGSFNFRGDANQLQQSLLNIVHNAMQACEDVHDPRIEINLTPFDGREHGALLKKYPVLRHGNFAHILIRDNGKGMPENILQRIFDPFFSTKQLGSGLGLAMVMGCVRHHHGIIDVESRVNEGSCFHLFLPILKVQKTDEVALEKAAGRSLNILLVDDDDRVLEPTKELLECMGHHVTLAGDGREACEIFEQQIESWDILITDIVMPCMNGVESAKIMRQLRPDLPVVFATGYDQSLVTDDVHQMGNTTLISKPFSPDDLDVLINKMVSEVKRA